MPEPVVKQSQELPVLYTRDNSKLIQGGPVQREAIQLGETFSNKETAVVYQQAAEKTWKLFKQAIALFFHLFLLLIALIIWVWGISFECGFNFRKWIEVEQPTIDEIIFRLFKFLVWPLKRIYEWANAFLKEHLGWDNPLKPKPSSTTSEV